MSKPVFEDTICPYCNCEAVSMVLAYRESVTWCSSGHVVVTSPNQFERPKLVYEFQKEDEI